MMLTYNGACAQAVIRTIGRRRPSMQGAYRGESAGEHQLL